jgi:hypothetical protein
VFGFEFDSVRFFVLAGGICRKKEKRKMAFALYLAISCNAGFGRDI